jgi:hypothetical protein
MAIIYLVSILHKIIMYSKYTPNITIISRPFMLIIIFEYTCNIIVRIHSKYTFVNPNIFNYIFKVTQNRPLYIHKVAIKLVTFATNGT